MYLHKLYSEPEGLFQPVTFHDGVNFIFGKKDHKSDPKKSLNGIGKSLLLDFIDFCFLSSYTKDSKPRLHRAKKLIEKHKIVLEFEAENVLYVVKRGIKNHKKVDFGKNGIFKTFLINDLKPIFYNIIFKGNSYQGISQDVWLRLLLPFFIKVENVKKIKFADPIVYIPQKSVAELNQYHFLLMGIDNTLIHENFFLVEKLKETRNFLKELKKIIRETYGFHDISDINYEASNVEEDIRGLELLISNYKLSKHYEEIEMEANRITEEIKILIYQNFTHRKKIAQYEASFKIDPIIDYNKVAKIYNECNSLLAADIKKSLEEAVIFREKLANSRKDFLKEEIDLLEKDIKQNEDTISKMENKRSELFSALATQGAIKDLSEAYLTLSQKKEKLIDIKGKINLYNDLQQKKADLDIQDKQVFKKIYTQYEIFLEKIAKIRDIFMQIYDTLYSERKANALLNFRLEEKKDAKILIEVSFPGDLSEGKNSGKILVYDFTVLFHRIKNDIKGPCFLIHDGIFNGMDKAHFVHLCEYLDNVPYRFQYIATLNEEGTLNEKFGNTEKITPEKIEEKAAIILTPTQKLLGTDF